MESGMTIRETAIFLGIRIGSVYSLVWAGSLKAAKTEGEWVVDRESVEAYQAQRDTRRERIRRTKSRSTIGRSVVDVTATARVHEGL
jgi:hypothetical protein